MLYCLQVGDGGAGATLYNLYKYLYISIASAMWRELQGQTTSWVIDEYCHHKMWNNKPNETQSISQQIYINS